MNTDTFDRLYAFMKHNHLTPLPFTRSALHQRTVDFDLELKGIGHMVPAIGFTAPRGSVDQSPFPMISIFSQNLELAFSISFLPLLYIFITH